MRLYQAAGRQRPGLLWAFETSKPTTVAHFLQQGHTSSNKATPPLTKPHLPVLLKQCHSLMTKHLNIQAHRGHSYSTHYMEKGDQPSSLFAATSSSKATPSKPLPTAPPARDRVQIHESMGDIHLSLESPHFCSPKIPSHIQGHNLHCSAFYIHTHAWNTHATPSLHLEKF